MNNPPKRKITNINSETPVLSKKHKPNQKKKHMRYIKKMGNRITHERITCGNESIKPELFLDSAVAAIFTCSLCKWVLSKHRVLRGCQHIYCKEYIY